MIRKILLPIIFLFNILAVIYLVLPTPKIKDLPNSVKSNEPGDTVQIPNVSAYYTNLTRTEVINFYKANYNGLFRIELNHPPEKAKEIIRSTIQSYYFEEFVLPYKESLYINGFEWENDVFTKPAQRAKNKLIFENKEYRAKITIRTFPVSIPKRLVSFFLTESVAFAIFFIFKNLFLNPKK